MFFFLIFHTKVSSSNDIEKKLITTMVYGTVLYIMFHVLLNSSQKQFFMTMRQYFWLLLLVDIIAVMVICRSLLAKMSKQTKGSFSGVGKRIISFLEGIIDTGIYSDNIDFDSQQDDVMTDLEAVKRRAGILKQNIKADSGRNNISNKVSFVDDNPSSAPSVSPEDAGGNIIDQYELQQVEDLINSLTTGTTTTNNEEFTDQKKKNIGRSGLGSTPISSLSSNDDNETYISLREGELPPALQPQYTVPKNNGSINDGRRIPRNPLQPDLAPRDGKPPPPPECVMPDDTITNVMKMPTTYNPNIWDDDDDNNQGDIWDNNSKTDSKTPTSEPDFSKPLPKNSIYRGIDNSGGNSSNSMGSKQSGSRTPDDSRSEVSEFDIDLGDFENSL